MKEKKMKNIILPVRYSAKDYKTLLKKVEKETKPTLRKGKKEWNVSGYVRSKSLS